QQKLEDAIKSGADPAIVKALQDQVAQAKLADDAARAAAKMAESKYDAIAQSIAASTAATQQIPATVTALGDKVDRSADTVGRHIDTSASSVRGAVDRTASSYERLSKEDQAKADDLLAATQNLNHAMLGLQQAQIDVVRAIQSG